MTDLIYGCIDDFIARAPYELNSEKLHRVTSSKVVYCDSERIARDFPWVSNVEDWLLSSGSWISQGNLTQSDVNPQIETDGSTITGYRAPRYGRASIIDSGASSERCTKDCHRLIELKGCGVANGVTPVVDYNGNGLLTLVDAYREVVNAHLLDRVFSHVGVDVNCLPVYGIIELGFDVAPQVGSPVSAAILVRQAHFRPKNNDEIPLQGSVEQQVKHRLEETIRKYNLTSTLGVHSFSISEDNNRLQATH